MKLNEPGFAIPSPAQLAGERLSKSTLSTDACIRDEFVPPAHGPMHWLDNLFIGSPAERAVDDSMPYWS